MLSKPKKRRAKTRARAPEGKRQVLIIMNKDVVKLVKVAAVEDDIKMSHAVEEAVRDWWIKESAKRRRLTRSKFAMGRRLDLLAMHRGVIR